jgi:hypothetical protein
MSDHWGVVLVLVALVGVASGVAPVTGTAAEEPAPPTTVEQTFIGTSADSEHAVAVTVTAAPTDKTGPINNTVVRLRAAAAAFITQSSVSTNETTGGDQVISRHETDDSTFEIGYLEPGETASISFRVYPKAVLPSGDRLATVTVETQFEATKRVVSERTAIAPTVNASQAAYAVEPRVSPWMGIGAGAVGATLLTVGAAAVYRRRRRAAFRAVLVRAQDHATSTRTKQALDTALTWLGGSGSDSDPESDLEGTDEVADDTLDLDFDD